MHNFFKIAFGLVSCLASSYFNQALAQSSATSQSHNSLTMSGQLTQAQREMLNNCFRPINKLISSNGKSAIPNQQQVIKACTAYADKGDAHAQFVMGILYIYGYGVKLNSQEAYVNMLSAVEQNFGPAYPYLAQMYLYGNGTKQNTKRAYELLQQAAKSGYAQAMYDLAQMYGNGIGVPVSQNLYISWLIQASKESHPASCYELGLMYYTGNGVKKNLNETARLMQLATKNDYPPALYTLGLMYLNGGGGR